MKVSRPLDAVLSWDLWRLRKHLNAITVHSCDTAWFVPSPAGHSKKVTLVSHIDTVFDDKRRLPRIFRDREKIVYWSPDGLGADDRAGVYSILKVYDSMPDEYKPNLLFCDGEEHGCWGALDAADEFETFLKDTLFFIELDRRGGNDCVFYNNEPKPFRYLISSYGFKEEWGTYSDISCLGEKLSKCAANLSIGYYGEHTTSEYLVVEEMERTIGRVIEIVRAATKAGVSWPNKQAKRSAWGGGGWRDTIHYGRADATRFNYWESVKDKPEHTYTVAPDDDDEPIPVDEFMDPGAMSTKISRKERKRIRRLKERGLITDDRVRDPFYHSR